MIFVPKKYVRAFVYVDCGARGEEKHAFLAAFPHAQYIGFEADAQESARLQAKADKGYRFFPVAVGRANETLPFYVTKNPACSSFLEPDQPFFGQFLEAARDTEVQSVISLSVVSLDDYLPKAGIHSIDFIELDTQGSELDILRGAEQFLKGSVLGLKIETEFSPIYQNQPLFSDVDSYVRSCGFVLFDLSRHRFRREAAPSDLSTRGQLLYGHAFYLRDYRSFSGPDAWEKIMKLSMIADFFGFWDYAYEMIQYLTVLPFAKLHEDELAFLAKILKEYERTASRKTRIRILIGAADRLYLRKLLEGIVRVCAKITSAYQAESALGRRSWVD